MKEFTVKDAIAIQNEQLAKYKKLLRDKVYIALSIYARKDNHLATCGNDICRGTNLSNFFENYLYYIEREELEVKLGLRGYEEYCRKIQGSNPSKKFPQPSKSVKNAQEKIKKEPETVKEWLNTLIEPYRSEAINNTNSETVECESNSLLDALSSAFLWGKSNEGFDYWNKVANKFC
jgi:hypothetical protein